MTSRIERRPLVEWSSLVVVVLLAATLPILLGVVGALLPIVLAGCLVLVGSVLLRPERAFYLYLVGLPIYLMSLVTLYGPVGLAPAVIRLAQAWKEILLCVALLGTWLRFVRSPKPATLTTLDWAVIAFVVLNLLYIVFPLGDATALARASGGRTNVTFALLYLLGRSASPNYFDEAQAKRAVAWLAALSVLIVVAEKAFLPDDWPLRLGYSRFLVNFYGGSDVYSVDELPWSFWAAGKIFRRPSGFYANPLDLAASCLLLFGLPLAAYFLAPTRRRRWLLLAAGLATTIALTLARMAIVSLPIVSFVVLFLLRRRRLAVSLLVASIGLGALSLVVAGPFVQQYLRDTLFFENTSSIGHLEAWSIALRTMIHHPLGLGLGSSGAVGSRTADSSLIGENQYLIFGTQLGWLGLVQYLVLLLLALRQVSRAFVETANSFFAVGVTGLLTICLVGLTSEINIYIFVSFITWWLVGYSVRRNLEASAQELGHL